MAVHDKKNALSYNNEGPEAMPLEVCCWFH